MYIVSDTLDDILISLYPALLRTESNVAASRGANSEIQGVLIELTNPRARLSRSETRGKMFSSLGELLWYLTGDNKLAFIERYVSRYREESEDGVSVYGGYGPRFFAQRGCNQIQNVLALLKERPASRRAVMQIFNAEDIASAHKEIPCTTCLQFLVRQDRVHMTVTMRSNDAYFGLPHDVFCFSMLQEIVARSLGIDVGTYRHFVASMHLYDQHRDSAQNFVEEGYQSRISMPEMPFGDPWPNIKAVLDAEARITSGEVVSAESYGLGDYWSDLIRMLQVFAADGDDKTLSSLKDAMSFARYRPYIESRRTNSG